MLCGTNVRYSRQLVPLNFSIFPPRNYNFLPILWIYSEGKSVNLKYLFYCTPGLILPLVAHDKFRSILLSIIHAMVAEPLHSATGDKWFFGPDKVNIQEHTPSGHSSLETFYSPLLNMSRAGPPGNTHGSITHPCSILLQAATHPRTVLNCVLTIWKAWLERSIGWQTFKRCVWLQHFICIQHNITQADE